MADRSVSIALSAQVSGFVAGMKTAQASAKGLMSELDKSAQKQQALKSVGTAFGVMGVAAAAGVGLAIKASMEFDSAMSGVQAATHETAGNMELLRGAAIDAGAATKYSANEAAGGIEALAKAGISTADILGGGLTGALSLAAAGGQDVSAAAESMATAMTQFAVPGAEATHVADLLAAAAGKAQGEVSDMSAALNQTGIIAAQVGVPIDDTVGVLAEFASKGLIGSDAGTSFKTMLQSLTPASVEAKAAIDKYNISAYDAQGNFIGMEAYAGKLKAGLSGLSNEQRNATMKTIFGSDAIRAASILYDSGAEGVAKWTANVDDTGYAAETAAIKMDNLSGDLETLKGSLETALIGTGEGAQGPLRDLTKGLTGVVNAYIGLPDAAKSTALAVGVFTAAVGLSGFAATRAVGAYTAATEAMTTLGISAARASAIMKGVGFAAVVVGAGALANALHDVAAHTDSAAIPALSNDLSRLGKTGEVTGEMLANFSADLSGNERSWSADGKSLGEAFEAASWAADSSAEKFENWISGGSEWVDRVKEMDTAITALAGKSMPKAAAAFEALAAQGAQQGLSWNDMLQIFPQYSAKLGEASAAFQAHVNTNLAGIGAFSGASNAMDDGAGSAQAEADALGMATKEMTAFLAANAAMAAAAVAGRHDQYSLAAAITAAEKATADATGGLNKHTEIGQANEAQLESLANTWNGLDKSVRNTKGTYEDTRGAFVDMAHQFGMMIPEANALADELLSIPKNVETRLTLGGAALAEAEAKDLRDAYNDLPKDVRTELAALGGDASRSDVRSLIAQYNLTPRQVQTVLAAYDAASGPINSVRASLASLDGRTASTYLYNHTINTITTVTKKLFGASGGPVVGPGGPRDDLVPAMLSNGEFVVNAAATSRNFGLLSMINAQQFAAGGPVRLAKGGRIKGDTDHSGELSKAEQAALDAAEAAAEAAKAAAEAIAAIAKEFKHFGLGARTDASEIQSSFSSLFGTIHDNLSKQNKGLLAGVHNMKDLAEALQGTRWAKEALEAAQAAVNTSFNSFGVGKGASADTMKSEVHDLEAALKATLGKGSPLLRQVSNLGDKLIKHAVAQDKATDALHASIAAQKAYSRTVADSFKTDIFGGGAAHALLQLKADANDANKMRQALNKAGNKGLDTRGKLGGLFKELAASGDLATAQELAGMSRSQIHKFELAYAARNAATKSLGQAAGQDVYGKQIKTQTATLHRLDHTLKQLTHTVDKIEHKVEKGSHNGARSGTAAGIRDLGKRANVRARA